MSYKLAFLPSALKEWRGLDNNIRSQLKKKLAGRLVAPHIISDRLSGFSNHYKIKLRAAGYRLVYEVEEDKARVLVIAVGKREKSAVYKSAKKRFRD